MVEKKTVVITSACVATVVALGAAAYYYIYGSEGEPLRPWFRGPEDFGDYYGNEIDANVVNRAIVPLSTKEKENAGYFDAEEKYKYNFLMKRQDDQLHPDQASKSQGTRDSNQTFAHTSLETKNDAVSIISHTKNANYVLNETDPTVMVKNNFAVKRHIGEDIASANVNDNKTVNLINLINRTIGPEFAVSFSTQLLVDKHLDRNTSSSETLYNLPNNETDYNVNIQYNVFKKAKRRIENAIKNTFDIKHMKLHNVSKQETSIVPVNSFLGEEQNLTLKNESRGTFSLSEMSFSDRSEKHSLKRYISRSKRNILHPVGNRAKNKYRMKISHKKLVEKLKKRNQKREITGFTRKFLSKFHNKTIVKEWKLLNKCLKKLRNWSFRKITGKESSETSKLAKDDITSTKYGNYLNSCIQRRKRQLAPKTEKFSSASSSIEKNINNNFVELLPKHLKYIHNKIMKNKIKKFRIDNNHKFLILVFNDDEFNDTLSDDRIDLEEHDEKQFVQSDASEIPKHATYGTDFLKKYVDATISDNIKRTKRQYNANVQDEKKIHDNQTNNSKLLIESTQKNIDLDSNIRVNVTGSKDENDTISERRKTLMKYFDHVIQQIPVKHLIADDTKLFSYIGKNADKEGFAHFIENVLQFIPMDETNRILDRVILNSENENTLMKNLKYGVESLIKLLPTEILLNSVGKIEPKVSDKPNMLLKGLLINETVSSQIDKTLIDVVDHIKSDTTEISPQNSVNNNITDKIAINEKDTIFDLEFHPHPIKPWSNSDVTESAEETHVNALKEKKLSGVHNVINRNLVSYTQVSTEPNKRKSNNDETTSYRIALAKYIGSIVQHIPVADLVEEKDEVSENLHETLSTDVNKLTTYIQGILRKIPLEVINKSMDYAPSYQKKFLNTDKENIVKYVQSTINIPINELNKGSNKTKSPDNKIPTDHASFMDYIRGLVDMIPADELPTNIGGKEKKNKQMTAEDRGAMIEHISSILQQFMRDSMIMEHREAPNEKNFAVIPKAIKLRRKRNALPSSTLTQRIKRKLVKGDDSLKTLNLMLNKYMSEVQTKIENNKPENKLLSKSEEPIDTRKQKFRRSITTPKDHSDKIDISTISTESNNKFNTETSAISKDSHGRELSETQNNKIGKPPFHTNDMDFTEDLRKQVNDEEEMLLISSTEGVGEITANVIETKHAYPYSEETNPQLMSFNLGIVDESLLINLKKPKAYINQKKLASQHETNLWDVEAALLCLVLLATAVLTFKISKAWGGARRWLGRWRFGRTGFGGGVLGGGGGDAEVGLDLDAMPPRRAYATATGGPPTEKGDVGTSPIGDPAAVHRERSCRKWKHRFHVTATVVGDAGGAGGAGGEGFATGP